MCCKTSLICCTSLWSISISIYCSCWWIILSIRCKIITMIIWFGYKCWTTWSILEKNLEKKNDFWKNLEKKIFNRRLTLIVLHTFHTDLIHMVQDSVYLHLHLILHFLMFDAVMVPKGQQFFFFGFRLKIQNQIQTNKNLFFGIYKLKKNLILPRAGLTSNTQKKSSWE